MTSKLPPEWKNAKVFEEARLSSTVSLFYYNIRNLWWGYLRIERHTGAYTTTTGNTLSVSWPRTQSYTSSTGGNWTSTPLVNTKTEDFAALTIDELRRFLEWRDESYWQKFAEHLLDL